MPFCRYCGVNAPEDALYCGNCGKTLTLPSLEQTSTSSPLQSVSQANRQEEQKRQTPAPFVPILQQLPSETVPVVQGTPQIGGVPSVSSPITSTAKAGMSALTKFLIVAASCAVIIAGGVKIVPIILQGANGNQGSSSGTHHITTVPMPPTQTSCPAPGTARAAVTASLALGSHQNIVYIDNEAQNNGPDIGTIKRYDVTTKATTEIVRLNNHAVISEAQVSADGQWVLFVAYILKPTDELSEIQMIRMDGQGLQTLYCSSQNNIGNIQWSPDKKSVVFGEGSIYLLDLTRGQLKSLLIIDPNATVGTSPLTWLDNTHIYITDYSTVTACNVYILDIIKASNGPSNNLQPISTMCDRADLYGSEHFSYQCNCTQSSNAGPSSITVQSTTSGSSKTIYTSQTLAITNLWVFSSTKLMLRIENTNGDTSQNGLWTINMDGTDLKKVISESELSQEVNSSGNSIFHIKGDLIEYPYWSNSSHDGNLYSIFSWPPVQNNEPCNMYFGSLNGGSLTRFASFPICMPDSSEVISLAENLVEIIGWTTM